jgi:hypothetical protein
LRRQLYVLDTYYNDSNRVANHTLMALHSYGSAVFTVAVAAALLQLLLAAAMVAGCCCCLALSWLGPLPVAAATGSGWLLNWGTWEMTGVVSGSLALGCKHLSAFGSESSSLLGVLRQAVAAISSPGLCVFVLCMALAQLSIWFMVCQCLGLLHELSPAAAAYADADANVGIQQQQQQQQQQRGCAGPDRQQLLHQARVSYTLLWAGWVLENSLVPACMAYTIASNWITWGGIRYRKAGGKVVEVVHPCGPI